MSNAEQTPMSDPDRLRSVIDYGAKNYPADKYDLFLISHGGGPSMGWGSDEIFQRDDGKVIMSVDEICGALKDSILGEQSGGGSCSVQYCGTADGWVYSISNNIHLINKAGEDIDSGVPVKEKLVVEGEDGSRDYSGFYDLEHLRESIG